jgi:hypothetical protein
MEHLPSEITDGYLIAAILQSDAAVRAIRRELNQVYPNLLISSEAIRSVLREMILRQEVLDSEHLKTAYLMLKQVNALSSEKRRTRTTVQLPQVSSNDEDEHVRDTLWHDKTQAIGGG